MYVRTTHGHTDPAKYDEVSRLVPDVRAAIQQLPGCQDVQVGIDRATGDTVSVSTFDTLEHAQFNRDSIAEPLSRLRAAGWQGDDPHIYECID